MENVKENKMGTMPVNKLLLSMAIPIMISMLVQAFYNVVDSIYVAKLSENSLTAVSMAFPVQNLMIAVGSGIGVGMNAILSRSLGEKKQQMADKAAMQGVFLTIIGFLIFFIFGIFGSEAFMRSQTDVAEILEGGATYIRICSIFSFGIYAQLTFERLLQATGRTLYTMFTQLTGAIINIILDPILIFGLLGAPKMGVAGAAAATVTGQIIAGILALAINLVKNHDVHFHASNLKPDLILIKNILVVGVPSILMVSIGSFMTYAMNRILMGFTPTAVAVFGIYFKLQSFVLMPIFGLNNGMVPIIAFNYGARNKERIHKTIRLSIMYAVMIMLMGLFCFQIFPKTLLGFFSATDSLIKIGVPALRIMSSSYIFAGICIIAGSVCQAFGFGIYSLITSVARQLLVLVPVAYIMSLFGRIELVWTSFPIAEIVSLTLSLIFLKKALGRAEKKMESGSF